MIKTFWNKLFGNPTSETAPIGIFVPKDGHPDWYVFAGNCPNFKPIRFPGTNKWKFEGYKGVMEIVEDPNGPIDNGEESVFQPIILMWNDGVETVPLNGGVHQVFPSGNVLHLDKFPDGEGGNYLGSIGCDADNSYLIQARQSNKETPNE